MKPLLKLFLGLSLMLLTSQLPAQLLSAGGTTTPDSIVQLTADGLGLSLLDPLAVPHLGTFWVALPGDGGRMAPWPCPPLASSLPTYVIAESQFLVDGTGGETGTNATAIAALEAQANGIVKLVRELQAASVRKVKGKTLAKDDLTPPGAGDGDGDGDSTNIFSCYQFDTNQLWLEIIQVTNQTAYLNLHNATNQVYGIWTTTNLTTPFDEWQVAAELWPVDTNCQPFTLPTLNRENLFVRAQDWTGNIPPAADPWNFLYNGSFELPELPSSTTTIFMQAADDATLSQYYDGWTYQAGYQGAVVIHQFAGWPYMVQNPPFGAQTVALVVPSGSNNTNEFASMSQVFTNQYPGLYPLHFYAAKNPDWPVGALCIFVDEAAVAYFAATNFDASYRLITTNLTLAAGVHTLTLLSLREVPGHSLDLDGVGFGPPPPPPRTNAITLTAASPAYADVLAKINYGKFLNPPLGSIDGDTLVLPAGTNVWTNGITISGITLRGSGTNVNGATCILDAVPLRGNQAFLINAIARSNAFTRVTGICFGNQSSTNKQYTKVELDFRSANPANIRLDHCMFDKLLGDQVSAHGLYGVALIDHCSFINTGTGGGCIMAFGETYYTNNSQDQCGDLSYALPSWYGSSNQLTVEDCYFYKTNPAVITGTAIDSYAGARFTFRHNVITNNLIATHGTDSGGRVRGPRHYEIYGNNMNTVGEYLALELRGGTGLVWSNTAAGPHPLFGGIENYRSLAGWNPFGGASGTNAWDLNDPTCYLTGVCSGNTTNYLQVATNNWPVNSYVGFMVVNLDTGLFSYVTSSSETGRVDYASYLTAADQVLVFSDGQNFAFYKVERAMDQVGNGMGDLILGDYNTETKISHTTNSVTGTVSWPNQIVDPVYCWSNTYNNVEGKLSSNYPTIREAISWTNAVRANYTPLAYPHPLNK